MTAKSGTKRILFPWSSHSILCESFMKEAVLVAEISLVNWTTIDKKNQ